MSNDRLIRLHNTESALRGSLAIEPNIAVRAKLQQELRVVEQLIHWLRFESPEALDADRL